MSNIVSILSYESSFAGRDLIIVRFFMGIAGGSFAISHFW